ncbi:hypothetical protein [Pendulispora rubella]|uniref:hypothetical protein n=1 Tax=Pendulispora rubella TaxID=2741070 RepID=UPI00374DFDE7
MLKHLQRLSEWNANGGTPASLGVELQGKLDFSQVGLMGHSRGGEGVRAAYNFYREANSPWPAKILSPVSFRALFEIGPVDGQLPSTTPPFPRLNADGTAWSVLLPMCDGDVSTLAGIWPYDRMLRIPTETPGKQKSTFTVWGANHNFYNTEWQETDSGGCAGHAKLWENDESVGSEKQRTTGLASMMGFFRANVGPNAEAKYNQIFNPMFELPAVLTNVTRVDRGYTDSSSSSITNVIEDFNQPVGTNSHGTPNDAAGITITHNTVPTHYNKANNPDQKAGLISWQTASTETLFQTNWTVAGEGQDISSYKTLDIRLSRQNSSLNPAEDTDLSIQLALADGSLSSAVSLKNYASVRGPVGGVNNLHPILQSARIPLSDFGTVALTKVRGVRFVFDKTASGAIYLGNVRLSNVVTLPASFTPALATTTYPVSSANGAPVNQIHTKGNAIKAIRRAAPPTSDARAADAPRSIEIELETAVNFPVRDAFPVLRIGERDFGISHHPNGDTRRIVFTVPETDFASARNGEKVTVYYEEYETSDRWEFSNLDKPTLR